MLEESWLRLRSQYSDWELCVLFSWMLSTFVYWAFGALLLMLDIYKRPQALYALKIQPERPYLPSGSVHCPPLRNVCCYRSCWDSCY